MIAPQSPTQDESEESQTQADNGYAKSDVGDDSESKILLYE